MTHLPGYDNWLQSGDPANSPEAELADYATDLAVGELDQVTVDGERQFHLECGCPLEASDDEVVDITINGAEWEATVRFTCVNGHEPTDIVVGDEPDYEAIAEARADARNSDIPDNWEP